MIDNPDVNCTLTKEQLNEVRARHSVISSANMYFTNYVYCYELAKKYKLDLQKELAKSEDEIADSVYQASGNRELSGFYGMLEIVIDSTKRGVLKIGEAPEQALERERNKLRRRQPASYSKTTRRKAGAADTADADKA